MKNRFILRLALFMAAVYLFSTCGKLPIEESQDAYDATKVIPKVLITKGSTSVLQTFKYDYSVDYYRAGSTWTWTVTDATIDLVSPDTRTATVLFGTKPANDTALVKVTETTSGGTVSPEKVIKVKVNPFCPLPNGASDLVGSWSGEDGSPETGFFPSEVVTSSPSGTSISVNGINLGWIANAWGETVVDAGTVSMTVNNNGTLAIAHQFCFSTDYKGYISSYWIEGSGTWSNCGTHPEMTLTYVLDNVDDHYALPDEYSGESAFTATLVMDGGAGKGMTMKTPKLNADEIGAIKKSLHKR
jgi:hypothetical protein